MAAAAALAWAWALGLSLGPGLGPGLGSAGQVPLLAWSTQSSLWPPPAETPAGQWVGEGQLEALLTPALRRGPPTVLLVLQEKLSLEDFTVFGGDGAFPRLQAALWGAGSSLVLPAVPWGAAGALPHNLARALGAAPQRLEGAEALPHTLRRLPHNCSQPTLLLLALPHSAGSSLVSPREALASNDELLGRVLSALREEELPYTAVFSALRPSRVHRAPGGPGGPGGPLGRSLLADLGGRDVGQEEGVPPPPPPPLRWPPTGPPQILLWAQNLSVGLGGEGQDLTPRTFGGGADVDLGGSSWTPQEARLVLKYSNVFGGTLNITLVLRRGWFPVSGRPWAWLAEVGVSLEGGRGDPPALFQGWGGAGVSPSPLSWSCGELGAPGPFLLPLPPPAPPAPRWSLLLRQVQLQAFDVPPGGVFGGASDCASFFTPGLWMGLLTGGLLLGGLLLGGGLLGGLRPAHRFDDPRAPPLPVPTSD